MFHRILIFTIVLMPMVSFSAEKERRGLMPELKINSTNEDDNQKKSLQSEVLITKTENQAIQALIKIIKKKKGSPQEPDLWYRLAELYMRRAKSGRFFDMVRLGDSAAQFIPPNVTDETAIASLKRAVQVYTKIEKEFPKFREMDSVLFNNAFASQQLKLSKNADALYYKVVTQHPKSPLVPDAYLALGELAYENHKFSDAIDFFRAIERFPQSRVYSYGLYKEAWTLYNLHRNDEAIDKLVQVVKSQDPSRLEGKRMNYNLRTESLRDLALFFGETKPADQAYSFFAKIASGDEIGESLYTLGKLYDSHSRHKEMNIFLGEFVAKQPLSSYRVKVELLMINGNETARDRAQSLKHLIAAAEVCKKNSDWRRENATTAELECDYNFSRTNVEMAKKWWDLWQKNKSAVAAKEIAEYTLQAFRIHLEEEDPTKPDTKTRYAYAELLFQLKDYRLSSEQYALVSQKSVDTKTSHDSSYSALVALEKAKEKKSESNDDETLVQLGKYYLQKYPHGEHALQIQFKIGFIAYDHGNFAEAEKWLKPLASDPKAGEFKRKSEDLILDILNSRKDYAAIKTFSEKISKQTTDDSRKSALSKIIREANYNQIQETAKAGDKTKAAEELVQFYRDNKGSPLAKDSLWQALSLYYADGKIFDGAETARIYAKDYPEDKRSLDALKDAAKNYADAGLILPAAQTMDLISTLSPKDSERYMEAASELYMLEGKTKQAQDILRKQLAETKPNQQGKLYTKLLSTMKGQEGSPEYQKVEDKILSLGYEPAASQIKLKKVEKLFAQGKMAEAFNAAKPLVATDSGIDDDVRARGRLIQAKVLEKEFVDTRTKTTVEKLALILGIKTEKLDKAQTAFLTSAKVANDPNTKLEALQGLNRIYTNYVDTVGHPILKDEAQLSDEDKKLLAEQLAKLTAPILDKKIETDKQLKNLAKDSKATGSNVADFSNLPAEETVRPWIEPLALDQLKAYLPVPSSVDMKEASLEKVSRFPSSARAEKCSNSESDKNLSIPQLINKANICVIGKNAAGTEKLALWMTQQNPQSAWGVFYMSLAAEMQGQIDKGLWLIELAMKKSSDLPFLVYQKARMLYQHQDFAQANSMFLKSYDSGLITPETTLMHGVVSFAQQDCLSVVEDFAKLDKAMLSRQGLAPVLSECLAQKGEFDLAIQTAEENLKLENNPADLWLEIARIQEIYRFDSSKAMKAYESALKLTRQPDTKEWIQRKLDFLKGKPKASRAVTSQEVINEKYN